MTDLSAKIDALRRGMRVRATFHTDRTGEFTIEGCVHDKHLVRGVHLLCVGDWNLQNQDLVALEVLTPKFEVNAWYEHPDQPGVLWKRFPDCFSLPGGGNRWDRDPCNDAWRAGLVRVTLPSEQQEQS